MKKVKFDVSGMTCSSCVMHVENEVKKLQGVKAVNVNLLSNNMIVEYDETLLDNEKIIKKVEEAGYGASCNEDRKEKGNLKKENNIDKVEQNIKGMKFRVIISFIFLVPLMYISMHHMLYEYLHIPVPSFISNIFDGTKNSITFAFTQFILLLPIIYVNRNYFITGFKRLFKSSPNMDSLVALGSSAAVIYGIFSIFMIGSGLRNRRL